MISGECTAFNGEMHFSDQPTLNREIWRSYGVKPGEQSEVVIRARAKSGADVSLEDIRLGFAAYERSAPRTRVDGFRLDDCQRWNGKWYTLVDYDAVDVLEQPRASLSLPRTDGDVLIGAGTMGIDHGPVRMMVDGRVISRADLSDATGSFAYQRISGDGHEVAVRVNRGTDFGRAVIAYYEPEE